APLRLPQKLVARMKARLPPDRQKEISSRGAARFPPLNPYPEWEKGNFQWPEIQPGRLRLVRDPNGRRTEPAKVWTPTELASEQLWRGRQRGRCRVLAVKLSNESLGDVERV